MIDFCRGVTVKSVRKSNRLKKMKPATSKNAKFARERKNIKHRKDENCTILCNSRKNQSELKSYRIFLRKLRCIFFFQMPTIISAGRHRKERTPLIIWGSFLNDRNKQFISK